MEKILFTWWNLQRTLKSEKGQGMVEYALVVALIGVACVGAMTGVTTQIRLNFGNIVSTLAAAIAQ